MWRPLLLLVMLAVALCGLDVGESMAAPAGPGAIAACASEPAHCETTDDDHPDKAGHQGHNHCPLATELVQGPLLAPLLADGLRFAAATAPLTSLTRAPPHQPPSA